MSLDALRILLLCILGIPAGAAILVAALGPRLLPAIRWISLGAVVLNLLLTIILCANTSERLQLPRETATNSTFQPICVPGDPGGQTETHATHWELLRIQFANERATAIQFYLGLDGLNIWLVLLTSFLMVPCVLVSWNSIQERGNEYYAWLLALQSALLGVFLAFDIILFYVFFELTLVPLFFLIGIWGGPARREAARKFFLFTLTGSLITLLGMIGMVIAVYQQTKVLTFSIPELVSRVQAELALQSPERAAFWHQVQIYVFLALAVGFAVKVPLFPLHTWLPLAHVEAPTAGSVLLAGVLLKLGTYGFLRLCLPLTPDAALSIGVPLIGTLSIIGIVYGALCAFAQDDVKKLVAYSSVSHLGFCMLGMFALNAVGIAGSLMQMINHGLSTGGLFLLVGMLYERYHTRMMKDYGGLAAKLKVLSLFMVFICLSSVGLPFLNGFVGEVLMLAGVFDLRSDAVNGIVFAVAGAAGIVLGAWYLFTMLQRVFFGPLHEPHHGAGSLIFDLSVRELAAMIPLAVVCLLIGILPQPILNTARRDIEVVARISAAAYDRAHAAAASNAPQTDAPQTAAR
ncbi:MAG TPA: NADH-quinone oxidoreductase subunit M [Gemmataceae bacterium]|jgi:NADH-quinone oxidoreductase subunit M|nr:NADH-quinone oxidoreductase subunit M [Gemmataceae bacterium]